jgi:hypothetical protein
MNDLSGQKFLVLLAVLLCLFVLYPILRAAGLPHRVYDVLFTLVLVAAFGVVFPSVRLRLLALVLGLPPVVGLWTGYVMPGTSPVGLAVTLHAGAALFVGLAVGVLLRRVDAAERVTTGAIYAACCGYLLLAVLFGHLFCITDWCLPHSFLATPPDLSEELAHRERLHFVLTYFSLSTLTTLGYGDIVPGTSVARGLAAVEAVVGQLYIAVLLAELIGKRVAQALAPRKPD